MADNRQADDGREGEEPNEAQDELIGEQGGQSSSTEPSQQEHHNPTTEEDTASGGAPEP